MIVFNIECNTFGSGSGMLAVSSLVNTLAKKVLSISAFSCGKIASSQSLFFSTAISLLARCAVGIVLSERLKDKTWVLTF